MVAPVGGRKLLLQLFLLLGDWPNGLTTDRNALVRHQFWEG